ncbi:WbqC family protein [candidate division KSB1 bacterium]|nr:WbqC family protein [candidate division KSB1 bacterium]
MKLTVVQPAYFPTIRTLSRISSADVVVWGETFVYKRNATIHRARIKTAAGAHWLTIPVLTKGRRGQLIRDVEIDPTHHWQRSHIKSLRVNYRNTPYYFFLAEEIAGLLRQKWRSLNDVALESTKFLCAKMGLPCRFVKSGDLPVVQDRSERVRQWLRSCGCETYVIEKDDEKYIDPRVIEKDGGRMLSLDFTHLNYHQSFGAFVADLSALDLLFNEGEMSESIVRTSHQLR